MKSMKKEIRIKNHLDELERVNRFVEEIGEELGLDMELQMNLNLVMEEMVVNVISYAYPEGTEASIELLAESDGIELLPYPLGCNTGHASVDLVKHHGCDGVLFRKDVFHGEHDAAQLAAGGDERFKFK